VAGQRVEQLALLVGEVAEHPVGQQAERGVEGVELGGLPGAHQGDESPVELVERACSLTPGLESPTVSPLHDRGWVAVRAMVPRATTNRVMDELWELGARGIIVTGIHACRL